MLDDAEPFVVNKAAAALARIGDPAALPALRARIARVGDNIYLRDHLLKAVSSLEARAAK